MIMSALVGCSLGNLQKLDVRDGKLLELNVQAYGRSASSSNCLALCRMYRQLTLPPLAVGQLPITKFFRHRHLRYEVELLVDHGNAQHPRLHGAVNFHNPAIDQNLTASGL